MNATTQHSYREWNRHQWADGYPVPDEPDSPRWNLFEWVGDTGRASPGRAVDPADMSEGDGGFSGLPPQPGRREPLGGGLSPLRR